MRVKALRPFLSNLHGEVHEGQIIPDCDAAHALQWIEVGLVQPVNGTYDTKVIKETPALQNIPLASGPVNESLSSPVAPASRKRTRKSSRASAS